MAEVEEVAGMAFGVTKVELNEKASSSSLSQWFVKDLIMKICFQMKMIQIQLNPAIPDPRIMEIRQ